jgi:DNA polymerase III delta subunit
MLYIIHGNDRQKGRAQFAKLRDTLSVHGENVVMISEGSVSKETLSEQAVTRGLFGEVSVFVFDGALEKKEDQEIVARVAPLLTESPNHFLIFEPVLIKEFVDEARQGAEEMIDCSVKKVDERPAFNIFSLGDALGERNKKELWVRYQQAVLFGLEPEEVCNTLFWTVKNMALMKNASSQNAGDLNPFVAKKAHGFAKNYTMDEITQLSHALMTLYHEGHRGGEPMNVALERFILRLV